MYFRPRQPRDRLGFYDRLLEPIRFRNLDKRLDECRHLFVFGKLFQLSLGEFSPWHTVGIFVVRQTKDDSFFVEGDNVAGETLSIRQFIRRRSGRSSEPCPKQNPDPNEMKFSHSLFLLSDDLSQ